MLESIINIIIFCIMPISGFLVLKNLLEIKYINKSFKSIILILVLIVINFIVYNSQYASLITILNFISIIIGYKIIFKINLFTSFLLCIVLMLFVFISDTMVYAIMTPIFGVSALRTTGLVMLMSNVLVGILCVLLSHIKALKIILNKLLSKLGIKTKFQFLVLAILWMIVITFVGYFIFKNSKNGIEFLISILIESIFIIFFIVYLMEKNKYFTLNDKFDDLFNYIQTIEDIIENEQLNIHEYKNQLTVIRGMSRDKRINDYIDSIVVDKDLGLESNPDLKKLPKGGLKGLLYYKCAIAKKKNIKLLVNINKNSCALLKDMKLDDIKTLSRVLGVYLDNAIEASEVSESKNLSIEIYNKMDKVNIVISNSIIKNLDVSKFHKKGYSTKGKNRGKGLYLVSKILMSNPNFEVSNTLINDYYVQRIVINN